MSDASIPKYRRGGPGGSYSYVRLSGKDHSLGRYGSPESRDRYDRLVSEWIARGRTPSSVTTVRDLCVGVLDHASEYYRKTRHDGQSTRTSQYTLFRRVSDTLKSRFGALPVNTFGPIELKSLRDFWVGQGACRSTVNKYVSIAVGIFRWGVEEGVVESEVWTRLKSVASIKAGRGRSKDHPAVEPVPEDWFQRTLAVARGTSGHLDAMLLLQYHTGMRPLEVCSMRWQDIDGDVYEVPAFGDKTSHRRKSRRVLLGPKALAVLDSLPRKTEGFVFTTSTGRPFSPNHYLGRVHDCAIKAGLPPWGVNRLRHNFAARVRDHFDLNHARACLGHGRVTTTDIYAGDDIDRARKVAQELS